MTVRIILACSFLGSLAAAQDPGKAAQSPELRAAQETFRKDKERALDAAKTRHLQKLRKLKEMAEGRNFELLKVIEAEIASLEFEKGLVETKWIWFRTPKDRGEELRFTADGTITQKHFKGRWATFAPWKIAIQLPDGPIGYLLFEPGMNKASGRDFG